MVFKSIISAVSVCLAAVSFNAYAIPTEADWLAAGDGLITYDATNNLEWLDFTSTMSRSYNDINSKFGSGEEFAGFRYATASEVSSLWNSFGGSGSYNGWSVADNGLFDIMAPLIGDGYCEVYASCDVGEGYNLGFIDISDATDVGFAQIYDIPAVPLSFTNDFVTIVDAAYAGKDEIIPDGGSWLVRDAPASVPEPSIAVLLASGLIAFGIVRRKSRA